MKRTRGRVVHIESLSDFDRRLAAGARLLTAWRVHGLDLRDRGDILTTCRVAGASFLGCTFAYGDDDRLAAAGALVLPEVGDSPLDVFRARLYTPDELYDTSTYAGSLDARGYAWSQRVPSRDDALAAALHDHAIDQALRTWVEGRSIVGVMGGHATERNTAAYAEAVRLGTALGLRHVVATGGGPGAMEAANLGARLSGSAGGPADGPADGPSDGPDAHELAATTRELLAVSPTFRPSIDAWVGAARSALAVLPHGAETLGVPTWRYGHEPPNLFATAIAKYVGNAVREAVLLEICNAGIVFLPGAAGTVQEIFQDACENYYADEISIAPMVLVGRAYWTTTLPAWPLLESLATARAMADRVHLVDTVDEAAAIIAG